MAKPTQPTRERLETFLINLESAYNARDWEAVKYLLQHQKLLTRSMDLRNEMLDLHKQLGVD